MSSAEHVEDTSPERVHLSVSDLEPDVSDAGSSGEPPRFGDLDPGRVRAQGAPAPAARAAKMVTSPQPHPDVENVLPVLDLRGGQQPRLQPTQHPLMPLTLLTLLDESRPLATSQSSDWSAFTATKATLHRSSPARTGA